VTQKRVSAKTSQEQSIVGRKIEEEKRFISVSERRLVVPEV
jgi:hypothetical protein